jgi:hypothetical protein
VQSSFPKILFDVLAPLSRATSQRANATNALPVPLWIRSTDNTDAGAVSKCALLAHHKPEASATAQVAAPSRYWLLSAEQLVKLRQSSPEIVNAIELGIAQDLRRKVESANKRSRLQA